MEKGFKALSDQSQAEERRCLVELTKQDKIFMAAKVLLVVINSLKDLMYGGQNPIVTHDLDSLIQIISQAQELNQKYRQGGEREEVKKADDIRCDNIAEQLKKTKFFSLDSDGQATVLNPSLEEFWRGLAQQLQTFRATEVVMPTQDKLKVISTQERKYAQIRNDYRWVLALFLFAFLGVGLGGTAGLIFLAIKVESLIGMGAMLTIGIAIAAPVAFCNCDARRSYNDKGTPLKRSLDDNKKTLNDKYSKNQRSLPEQVQRVQEAGETFFVSDSLKRNGVFAPHLTDARMVSHTDSNRILEEPSAPPGSVFEAQTR